MKYQRLLVPHHHTIVEDAVQSINIRGFPQGQDTARCRSCAHMAAAYAAHTAAGSSMCS